jgi:hypothetical protein
MPLPLLPEEASVTTLGYGGLAPSNVTDAVVLQRHRVLADRLATRCWHATPLPVLEAVATALDQAMDGLVDEDDEEVPGTGSQSS